MKFITTTIYFILPYKVQVEQLSSLVCRCLKVQLRSTDVYLGPYRTTDITLQHHFNTALMQHGSKHTQIKILASIKLLSIQCFITTLSLLLLKIFFLFDFIKQKTPKDSLFGTCVPHILNLFIYFFDFLLLSDVLLSNVITANYTIYP